MKNKCFNELFSEFILNMERIQPRKNVYTLTKIDLNAYKERQMKRRIDALIAKHKIDGYESYVKVLKTDQAKYDEFVDYIIESVRDVMSIENTGQFHGVYHVLGGIISPINGVGPSDLTIRELVSRVSDLVSPEALFEADGPGNVGDSPEVILALSGDVEGETTSFYIYRQIAGFGIKMLLHGRDDLGNKICLVQCTF